MAEIEEIYQENAVLELASLRDPVPAKGNIFQNFQKNNFGVAVSADDSASLAPVFGLVQCVLFILVCQI